MVVEVINMEEDENSQIQLQDKDDNMEIAELYLEDEDPLQDKGQSDRDMTTCFGFVVSNILSTLHPSSMAHILFLIFQMA